MTGSGPTPRAVESGPDADARTPPRARSFDCLRSVALSCSSSHPFRTRSEAPLGSERTVWSGGREATANTEKDYQTALESDPLDWHLWQVFADWLGTQGDPRAAGYQALGLLRRTPVLFEKTSRRWNWMNEHWAEFYSSRAAEVNRAILPDDWYDRLPQVAHAGYRCAFDREALRESLDDAALAFAKLEPDRLAELLTRRPAEM